jgi:hypothetical protein
VPGLGGGGASAPLAGVAGPRQLDDLYGIGTVSGDVDVPLRHRAVLLGLVGVILVVAAFVRSLRVTATAVGVVSTASFIVVAMLGDTSTSELHRLVDRDAGRRSRRHDVGGWDVVDGERDDSAPPRGCVTHLDPIDLIERVPQPLAEGDDSLLDRRCTHVERLADCRSQSDHRRDRHLVLLEPSHTGCGRGHANGSS